VSDGAIGTLAVLEQSGALTPAGLVLSTELSYDRYEALLVYLSSVHRRSAWALGDALLYGEQVFSETYAQAASLTGFSPQYLQNLASICRRVPRPRRQPLLSMGHHDVVAKMEPAEQTEWLGRAVDARWTREEMRAQVDNHNGKPLPPAVERCSCCGRAT
jgi:hypothetical protein